MTATQDPLLGRLVGSYQVIQKLGEGGMGAVYLATSELTEKSVVIKVLQPEFAARPEIAQRFHNEAKAAGRIDHENVVAVYEVGAFEDNRQWIMMEFLRGQDLAHYIARRGPLPLATAIAILAQAARGVQAGHDKGILHRDLKPENVFILAEEPMEPRTVKVLDFGLAKVADSGVKTRTHAVAGTPGYMAPEQAMGLGLATTRSDVFALGCILFQMLTGRQAWSEETVTMTHAAPDSPPDPRVFRPDLPETVAVVIQLAMAFDARMRPESPRALIKRLVEASPGAAEVVKAVAKDMTSAGPEERTWYPPSGVPSGAATDGTLVAKAVSKKETRSWGRAGWIVPLALLVVIGGSVTAVMATRGNGRDSAVAAGTPSTSDAATIVPSADASAARVASVPAPLDAGLVASTTLDANLPGVGPADAAIAAKAAPDARPAVPPHGGAHHSNPTTHVASNASLETGLLKVTVTKTYAAVSVDGSGVGPTPVTQSLPVGRHHVKMENPDLGQRYEKTVVIKKDETTAIERDW